MITAEISVIPVGTQSTSLSKFIAEAEKILKKFPDVKNKLTATGTEIECKDANELFEILKEMHLAPFNMEAQRVYTVIKIDDRHDKENTMEEKIGSVLQKV